MDPGFDPLNWNSLGIPDFIEACDRGIATFETTVNSVQKNSELINKCIKQIRQAKLVDIEAFRVSDHYNVIMSCHMLCFIHQVYDDDACTWCDRCFRICCDHVDFMWIIFSLESY